MLSMTFPGQLQSAYPSMVNVRWLPMRTGEGSLPCRSESNCLCRAALVAHAICSVRRSDKTGCLST